MFSKKNSPIKIHYVHLSIFDEESRGRLEISGSLSLLKEYMDCERTFRSAPRIDRNDAYLEMQATNIFDEIIDSWDITKSAEERRDEIVNSIMFYIKEAYDRGVTDANAYTMVEPTK